MKVNFDFNQALVTCSFEMDDDDLKEGGGQGTMKVKFLRSSYRIKLPQKINIPHPDLLAFIALVSFKPWIGRYLRLQEGVSEEFANCTKKLFGIDITPVNLNLKPRSYGIQPSLSYSGGIDSVAASEVLPKDTPYIHYKRVDHLEIENRAKHVRVDAITDIVEETANRGRRVYIVESDLEHICDPYPTLPHWFAIAIPALILADELNIGMLAMGGTFETFFMDMGKSWKGPGGKGIDPLADVVGINLCRPMLGVTEIGTMKLALDSELGDIARSCVLGTRQEPCGKCAKCVRKIMIEELIKPNEKNKTKLMSISDEDPGMKIMLGKPPYYMQAQLEYTLSRMEQKNEPLDDLYSRLGKPEVNRTEWMLRYYYPAIDYSIPENWKGYIFYMLSRKLEFMTEEDIDKLHNYTCYSS